jgi:hypothetical protein
MRSAGNSPAPPVQPSQPESAEGAVRRPRARSVESKRRRSRSTPVARAFRALGIVEMSDDVELLVENEDLLTLLTHYATATGDREAWLDRVMTLDDAKPEELVRMHGLLIAGDLLEQNTGATPVLRRDGVPCCYRVTTAGQRALRRVQEWQESGEEEWS